MTRPSKQVTFDDQNKPDYEMVTDLAKRCGGWMNVGGREGSSVEIWLDDTEYILKGESLIKFLYAVKDRAVDQLYAAKGLCEYIEQSAKVAPSVFTRDAIVHRARRLKAEIEGTQGSGAAG